MCLGGFAQRVYFDEKVAKKKNNEKKMKKTHSTSLSLSPLTPLSSPAWQRVAGVGVGGGVTLYGKGGAKKRTEIDGRKQTRAKNKMGKIHEQSNDFGRGQRGG